jgi:hypothetical protein
VKLLDAKSAFMVGSGCSRVRLLATSDPAVKQLVELGTVDKLVALVRQNDDPGTALAARNELPGMHLTSSLWQSELRKARSPCSID